MSKSLADLSKLSVEELVALDQEYRQAGYKLEGEREKAFKTVHTVRAKIRANHEARDAIAAQLLVRRQVEEMSQEERDAMAAALATAPPPGPKPVEGEEPQEGEDG